MRYNKSKFQSQQSKSNYHKNYQNIESLDSFDITKTKLPKDTRDVGIRASEIDNFYLKLNKGARFEINPGDLTKSKFEFFKVGRDRRIQFQIKPHFGDFNFSEYCKVYKEKLKELNLKTKTITLKPFWRMVIGLGVDSVYESSLNLHHIYGFPYVPGSAIKGVIRNWVIYNYFHNEEEYKKGGALSNLGFCKIFGSPKESILGEHVGSVCFFDAFPKEKPKITPDIINPHYNPYYLDDTGKTPPADYHNPEPVFFLTVHKTPFEFIFGIKAKKNKPVKINGSEANTPLEWVEKWLMGALSQHGIGAKTAVGYGYMEQI